MKTYSQKPSDVSRRWVLFDASELPLGRLATEIAKHLTGGCRTLLVSTDPAHSTSDVLEVQLGADITPVAENF